MADVHNDTTPPKPDVPKDVPPKDLPPAGDTASAAAASTGAGNKMAAEVHGGDSAPPAAGATPTDGKPPVSDKADPAAAPESNGLVAFAQSAWDQSSAAVGSWAKSAENLGSSAEAGFLDFASNIFSSDAAATPAADAKPAAAAAAGDSPSAKGAAVTISDGQATVVQGGVTGTRDADGTDRVVTGTGMVATRDARTGDITETGGDGTTTIDKDHIHDRVGGFDMDRKTRGAVEPADVEALEAGHSVQGSNGIGYRAAGSYSDGEGGGTVFAGTDGSKILVGKDGDSLVLDPKNGDVHWTEAGGQTQTMSLEQFKQQHSNEFAGFHLGPKGEVSDTNNGVVVNAQAPTEAVPAAAATPGSPATPEVPATPGSASIVRTDPTTHEVVADTVRSDGTSEMKHDDASGVCLSDSKINYNDPEHAYQQLDPSTGSVLGNFDITSDVFSGNGFDFTDSGMQVGDVTVADSGSISTTSSDSLASDGSLSVTSDGEVHVTTASGRGASQDEEALISALPAASAEISSALSEAASGSTIGDLEGARGEVQALLDLTGGKNSALAAELGVIDERENTVAETLDKKATRHELRSERAELRNDRNWDRDNNAASTNTAFLDLGTRSDLYGSAA